MAVIPNYTHLGNNGILRIGELVRIGRISGLMQCGEAGRADKCSGHGGRAARSRAPCGRSRPAPLRNARDRERVLRIGYLSPDFRSHSVADFTCKLIGAHDRNQFENFCYSNVIREDAITQRFKAYTDHWLSIVGMDDEGVAARIGQDRIDILVDLAGYTAENRILIFAREPAPILVNWLGYPNTTGLKVMDYRLTDSIADPDGEADRLHSEKLVRLKHGFLCYQATGSMPPVSGPSYRHQGHITFGSFNHPPKITPAVIGTWAKILESRPDARLVLKGGAFVDAETREYYSSIFGEHGISPERLDLICKTPSRNDHLETYSRIDISLDPFPYNGTTTTCEALWMGVPVITLRGNRHAGRVGASILHHLGCPELIAENENEYIELACRLADDTGRLETLRTDLRHRMSQSELMNLPQFTETLENAYREMWTAWCDENP